MKDSEFHIRSRKKSLSSSSNAGGKFDFKERCEKWKKVRKGELGYNWITTWKWPLWHTLWQFHGSESTNGFIRVVAWPPGGQLCWHGAAGQWQCPEAKDREPAGLPISPSVGHFLSQLLRCAKPRPCPQELSKGRLLMSLRGISVLWALCCVVLSVRTAGSLWHLAIMAMKRQMFEGGAPLAWKVSMCQEPSHRWM